jgi:hypothetical protein
VTRVLLQLKGETEPRPCAWCPEDFTQLADLDLAVGGLGTMDLGHLWHLIALLWVCCEGAREQWTLREFGRRLPGEARDSLLQGARLLWLQIT